MSPLSLLDPAPADDQPGDDRLPPPAGWPAPPEAAV